MDYILTIRNKKVLLVPIKDWTRQKFPSTKEASADQTRRNKIAAGYDPLLDMSPGGRKKINDSITKIKKNMERLKQNS